MLDLITTFNKDLYDKYSKNLLETFLEKSDESIRLNIFYEGDFKSIIKKYSSFNNKIRFYEFESHDWNVFYKKFGHLVEANGYKIVPVKNKLMAEYKYKWNAVKFSFKVFSIYLASKLEEISDKIAWIDADTICIDEINESHLNQFLPNKDEIMTYLGRDSWPANCPHSETGFIGFNLLHEKFQSFIKTAISFYTTGEIFTLDRYHDCLVYDTTRNIFEMTGAKFRCLSGEFKSEEHPFVKCGLGMFFDHLKGDRRKIIGFSPEHPNHKTNSIMDEEKIVDKKFELNFI